MSLAESLKLEGGIRSVFGRLGEPPRTPGEEFEDELRQRRLEVARRVPGWTELEETALVKRGRWFVHAETDEVFSPVRGVVFATASTTVVADRAPYYFCVLPSGGLAFFEKVTTPATWSEHVERQARRRS
jgi:hypothetical protein